MPTLNLGILAHVDAGKTSLTERILFETGVIAAAGRVDDGTTQTDSLDLERQRGITIQSAVASFHLDGLAVNLIDTPGHSDFIAEVGRALHVLDAVIVVISAVEGVQSQTRRLVHAVRTSGLPLLLFVNKIDRSGARSDALVEEIARGLDLCPVVMSRIEAIGTRDVTVVPHQLYDPAFKRGLLDTLSEHDDRLIGEYLDDGDDLSASTLSRALARQVRIGEVVPLFFGSAITGAGVSHLLAELPLLVHPARPKPCLDADGASGVVFKIQRTARGEKVGLVRLYSGCLGVRDHVVVHRPSSSGPDVTYEGRVTGLERYRPGGPETVQEACGGDIARVHGIPELRIGDVLGEPPGGRVVAGFPPPTLESVIDAVDPADRVRMNDALEQLEEQDPLISVHRGIRDRTVSLRLYGEVQKEVIEATLRDEFNIAVTFAPSRTLCIERVTGVAEAGEEGDVNPFGVTVFIRIEPGPRDSGIAYHRQLGIVPLGFYRAIEEVVFATLEEGLQGWPVRDCVVTLTRVTYPAGSVPADFRNLTPLVLMQALREAGTEVCEPIERFVLDVPPEASGDAYAMLGSVRATPEDNAPRGAMVRITGTMPASEVHRFEQHLPAIGRGEAVFVSGHAGYRRIDGPWPERARTDFDPLNRKRYLALLSQS